MKRCLQSISFCVVSLLLCNNGLFAQSQSQSQLSIKNFAIFGGDSTASFVDSLTSGVQSASIVTITGGGLVGTQTFLQLKDTVKIDANVYGNIVTIGSNFILNGGSLSVFNRQNFNYNVLREGNFSQYSSPGNINVNGPANIGVVGGTVNGAVTISSPYSYIGPAPANGIDSVSPVFPTMPVMPPTTAFPAAGATNLTSTQSIVPGSYGNMNLSAQQTIAFSGPGIYVFNSITNLANDTFKFDFQNNTTGSIRIYVVGNVDLNSINTVLVNGGSPSRVYMENHGTSFIINTAGNFDSRFTGIIYAPLGSVTIGNPNVYSIHVTTFTGSVWSRKKVTIGYNTTFNFAPLSESANPSPNSVILPYYIPPADGKVNTIIGSELTSLYEHPGAITQDSIIYRISGNGVYIEAITIQGQYAAALGFLQSNGLTNIINNGEGTVIISGKFPIANLLLLNAHSGLFNYVRPLYYPINNSGVVTTSGDTVMSSNIVRKGYNLDGTGVKVGVISDSYNTIPGNYAGIDVSNGDLPGAGNPDGNTTPVQILQEYPFGPGVDEGRAMLQIVHDMAPNAPLAFTTGFVSAGNFAQGIEQLLSAGCNVIVDDVTYMTEPFFQDGIVAKAVDDVVANGASYFSAAGNFGNKSYESTFSDMAPPPGLAGITGTVHDFGGGNPFQKLNLTPGNYTIVLQWVDNIYSVGAANGGTQTDLDIYLTDNLGANLFGFNRNNIGTDPIEVLPFTVTANTTASIVIAKASGLDVHFKYIVFRGNLTFANYAGSSTLVGQANSNGAIAVGAVLYSNTPFYHVPIPTIASFSSVGGTPVNGIVRNKPELTGPDGVNTTVNFGSYNIDHDAFPNFYGTSASAPHAAASAALIIQGQQKFLGKTISPANIKTLFENTALNMNPLGLPPYNPVSGYGFIQPLAAMETFASPVPEIDSMVTVNPVVMPVTAVFTVTIKGKAITPLTQVYFANSPLTTTFVDNQTVVALIPVFNGNPSVKLFNPSIIPAIDKTSFTDGGFSDSLFFFSSKKHIVITADNKEKKYGEVIPPFTASITVDGVPIQNTTLKASDLKLDQLVFTTSATTSSNVSNYYIRITNPLNPVIPADLILLSEYTYEFVDGILTVDKLPLMITPRDTILTYGQRIHGIQYNYVVGPSANLQNPDSLMGSINLTYTSSVIDSILALVNGSGATSRALVNSDLANLSIMISSGSGATSRALVNNGDGTTETSYFVDVDVSSIFNYLANPASSPLVNGSGATSRALVNTGPLINGTASVLGNGSGATSRALVNGNSTLLNSTTAGGSSNTNVAVIVSSNDVPNATGNLITETSVNMVTNGIGEGLHTIVPAAFISGNFDISYGLGTLTITSAPLTITANNQYTNNGVLPPFTSTMTGYQFQDASIPATGAVYKVTPTYNGNAGVYTITPSALSFAGDSDYLKKYISGTLYVNPYNWSTRPITLELKCVAKLKNSSTGFAYVAHFTAQNSNATTVYVPLGNNNYITATGKYSGVPPTVFPKGTTKFNVYFTGSKITWTLKTLLGKSSCAQTVSATSNSDRCSEDNDDFSYSANQAISETVAPIITQLYPNPANNELLVTSNVGFASEKDIILFDVYGRVLFVSTKLRSAQMIHLDISTLAKGTYFIRIKQKDSIRTLSFIKL